MPARISAVPAIAAIWTPRVVGSRLPPLLFVRRRYLCIVAVLVSRLAPAPNCTRGWGIVLLSLFAPRCGIATRAHGFAVDRTVPTQKIPCVSQATQIGDKFQKDKK